MGRSDRALQKTAMVFGICTNNARAAICDGRRKKHGYRFRGGNQKKAVVSKNVKYLGHRSFEEVEKLFDETSIFVNTSIPDCEGFPNTFLQAWSRGVPVISFFDPDGLIAENNLGIVVKSISQMKEAVEFLLKEQETGPAYSHRIQEFFYESFQSNLR